MQQEIGEFRLEVLRKLLSKFSVSLTVDHIASGNTKVGHLYLFMLPFTADELSHRRWLFQPSRTLRQNILLEDVLVRSLQTEHLQLVQVYLARLQNYGQKEQSWGLNQESLNNTTLQSPWYTGGPRIFLLNEQMDKSVFPIISTV